MQLLGFVTSKHTAEGTGARAASLEAYKPSKSNIRDYCINVTTLQYKYGRA